MDIYSENGELRLNGQRFHLKGANWFGYETETKCLNGLWSRRMEDVLDFLVAHSFNAIRVPFAADLAWELDAAWPASNVDLNKNYALQGKTSGQTLDHLVAEAGKRGLLIMLDMHRIIHNRPWPIPELWHLDDEFPEWKVLQAWTNIVNRYRGSWNVFAVDLKNEPHDSATWGSGDFRTDWKAAAERIGNAMLAINPKLLIFVEGISGHGSGDPEPTFWGGSLASAKALPVQLSIPNKLVYSPHVYGAGVWNQPYFQVPEFPWNMPGIWSRHFGHLLQEPKAGPAVVVGEWGGKFEEGSNERTWAEAFVPYLQSIGATDQFFWSLNPESGDTGGLLWDDWWSPHYYKLDLVKRLCPSPSRIEVDSQGQPINVLSPPGPWPLPPGDITVDTSAISTLIGSAKIIKDWESGEFGHQYQIEGVFKNESSSMLSSMVVELQPSHVVQQLWNLTPIQDGYTYGLPAFCSDNGGMQPYQAFGFGCIVSNKDIKFVVRPGDRPVAS